MRDYPPVTDTVTRARNGNKQAWDEIVERYAPPIWSICRQYRLVDADVRPIACEERNLLAWMPQPCRYSGMKEASTPYQKSSNVARDVSLVTGVCRENGDTRV
jgi:hypothetical protein